MKKVIFVVLALIVVVGMAQAADVLWGLRAGLAAGRTNKNWEDPGYPYTEKHPRHGFAGGVTLEIPLGSKFSILGEVSYIQKGQRYEGSAGELILKFDYIQWDALVKFHISENYDFVAGPEIGFLISASQEWNNESQNIENNTHPIEFVINCSVQRRLFGSAYAELGFSRGLNDVYKEGDFNFKHSAAALCVGFHL